jgi:hypothetical protein
VKLGDRSLLSLCAHPVALLQATFHHGFDATHQCKRGFLVIRREHLLHERLAERIADLLVDEAHAALPARLHRLGVLQVLALELEVLAHERRR